MSRAYVILVYVIVLSMRWLKIIFFVLSAIYYLRSTSSLVHASAEFTTSFTSVYTIEKTGTTTITHTIALANNLANIYATDYTLATSGDHLTNITARDEAGPLTLTSSTQNGVTTIHLLIAHPAVGKDKTKTITLTYQTSDVAEVIGDTTTIQIPRLARANEAETYTRIVKISGYQNAPTLIYPLPNSTVPEDPYVVYTFVGHPNDSLTLLLGNSVTYKLNLTYLLKNTDFTARESELALPPDTPYQHVLLKNIDPAPSEITIDQDGNWLARYKLKAQDKLTVMTELYVTVYPTPSQIDPSSHTLEKTLHSRYWNTDASLVTDLANQLKSPFSIYSYLVDNFTYNYAKLNSGTNRLGALAALASPSLVLCTEFTDTFVSLTRSLNIPAREINGYGYTTNSTLRPQSEVTDVLHSWPEYYDTNASTWISVDPTWGNTTGGIDYFHKLDFSHIAFVRHGIEDSYPLPAGAYKDSPSQKFIQVDISRNVLAVRTTSVTRGNVIYNTGNVALIDPQAGYIPPYGHASLVNTKPITFYDKIKLLCANLWSKFRRLLPASM